MKAIYPFVGGTATSHQYNLKDPRNLNEAFFLTFLGGWTHSNTGAIPNGTSGYANTKLNPANNLNLYSNHISVYSRTDSSSNYDMSTYDDGRGGIALSIIRKTNTSLFRGMNCLPSGGGASTSNNNGNGFYINSRISNNSMSIYKNGNLVGSNTDTASNLQPRGSIVIGATSYNTDTIFGYSSFECAFASIGDGLTSTEAENFYLAVQAFQTTLGRQV
jgi:hypothetical protein